MTLQCPLQAVIHVVFCFTILIISDDEGTENIELCPVGALCYIGLYSTEAFYCFPQNDFSMN